MACQIDTEDNEERKNTIKSISAKPTERDLYCHHPANASGMPRSRPSTTTAPVLSPMGFLWRTAGAGSSDAGYNPTLSPALLALSLPAASRVRVLDWRDSGQSWMS